MKTSILSQPLKQSGIRAASVKCAKLGGINLGQGVCDIPIPPSIKQGGHAAIDANKSIYSPCEGIFELRQAIAEKFQSYNGIKADAESNVIVTHGSTGAFVCAIKALFNPGDEIILFEPFYGYHKNILALHGLEVKAVPIHLTDFSIDFDELKKAIGKNTRGIVICTPCNPCGKVFDRNELLTIGRIAREHDLAIITDEIYEYITYPGHEHISMASLEDFADRTITISGFSKTYNMTGWRLGYATGPTDVIKKMALIQDLLYVCPATPLQHAVLQAFKLPQSYYDDMRKMYLDKRDLVVSILRKTGFKVEEPQGAYYLLLDYSEFAFDDDEHAANIILEQAKVALVAGRSFFHTPNAGNHILRLCYSLDEEQVHKAMDQIAKFFQQLQINQVN